MEREKCKYCERPIASESQWRSISGWNGYPSITESEWCFDQDECKAADERRSEIRHNFQELADVKVALLNHNLCGPECTPAEHIKAVYRDLELATQEIRRLKGQDKEKPVATRLPGSGRIRNP